MSGAACLSFSDSQIQSRDKARARKMAWGPHTVTQPGREGREAAGSPLEIVILTPPTPTAPPYYIRAAAAE